MAVTEYKPINTLGCRYSYDKLENVVYLVSEEHLKKVYIDNGEAYISGLTETPMRLDCFNISFTEDSSLDERYKFTKQLTFSLHGYVPYKDLNGKFYAILKSKDGTKWMVNVDFPSKVTYTFNLNGSQYQTDFTFSSVSNFPTLRLATEISEGESPCKELQTFGIDKLKMLESDYCTFDHASGNVHTYGHAFVDVDFLGQTCSLEERFDGEKVTTTIKFNIAFDAYKSSWHYNLLEFLKNRYSAIIKAKGVDTTFFSGFDFGLEPSFNISTTTQNGESDIITVTLVETSIQGSTSRDSWSEIEETETEWVYIRNVGLIQGWECVGLGVARYLLQEEVNMNGEPTGRYKAYSGYSGNFPTLNIVGEFSEQRLFSNSDCKETICQVQTDIPTTITYRSATCNTYSYFSTCDWNVSGLASYITVTPSSGSADNDYTLTVCNTKTPTTNEYSTFQITAGNNVKVVNVYLTTDASILNPQSANINCLAQNVSFTFNSNCPITVTSIDQRLTYQLTNAQLVVNVPRNYSVESGITWSIAVKDCNNNTQTVTINQDKTYESWVNTDGYLCSGTTSYVKQQRYTGTTSTSINTPTTEYRMGSKIADGDSRCGSQETRWISTGFTCIDGDKWSVDEQEISTDGGTTWVKNGVTKLGAMVESASSFCNETVEYKWVLTDRWQCYGDELPLKFSAVYSDSSTYSLECNSSSVLYSGEVKPSSYEYSAMTSAVVGDCVTSLDSGAFDNCSSLSSCTIPSGITSIGNGAFSLCGQLKRLNSNVDGVFNIPSGVTEIGDGVFRNCRSLTSIDLPSGITSIGEYTFYGCTILTSCTIPSGVTSIGRSAFSGCYSLTSATIPNSVTSIGTNSFYACHSLTSINIPNNVTRIGDSAFYECSGLTSCTIPSGVTSIEDYTFYHCYSLTSVNISSGVTSIGDWVFGSCRSLTSIDIPNSVTDIGISAFYACSGVTSCTIGTSVTSIGNMAFSGCTSLTSITIPNSVTSIGNSGFRQCTSLTSCTIGSGVTSIERQAFYDCSGLTSVTINATTPPSLANYVFTHTSASLVIYVPAASVDTYKSASGWSDYADRIQAIP